MSATISVIFFIYFLFFMFQIRKQGWRNLKLGFLRKDGSCLWNLVEGWIEDDGLKILGEK